MPYLTTRTVAVDSKVRLVTAARKIEVVVSRADMYEETVVSILRRAIENAQEQGREAHVALTGGKTAEAVYRHWSTHPDQPKPPLAIYLSDERCVPVSHSGSNQGMVRRSLFSNSLPAGIRMIVPDVSDPRAAAREYDQRLPSTFDLLLFTLGADGHFASLFPGELEPQAQAGRVAVTVGPPPFTDRVSLTVGALHTAREIVVLARGRWKGELIWKMVSESPSVDDYPAAALLGYTWVLDEEAVSAFDEAAESSISSETIRR